MTIRDQIDVMCKEQLRYGYADYQFLIEMANLCIQARRTIGFTYAIRFYLRGRNKQYFFDFLQIWIVGNTNNNFDAGAIVGVGPVRNFSGDKIEEATPVPMPNTEVKFYSGENSLREDSTLPGNKTLIRVFFLISNILANLVYFGIKYWLNSNHVKRLLL